MRVLGTEAFLEEEAHWRKAPRLTEPSPASCPLSDSCYIELRDVEPHVSTPTALEFLASFPP